MKEARQATTEAAVHLQAVQATAQEAAEAAEAATAAVAVAVDTAAAEAVLQEAEGKFIKKERT